MSEERQQAVMDLLAAASAAMSAGAVHNVEVAGATRLATQLPVSDPLPWEPSSVPVVAELGDLASSPLLDAARPGLAELPWRASPRVDDDGSKVALAFLNETFELGDLGLGVIAIGAEAEYPLHNHPPSEVYIVLGGTAEWRWGGADEFATVEPGAVIHNNPNDWHAIRTSDDPVFALWVLYD